MNEGPASEPRPIYLEIHFEDPQLVLSSFTTERPEPLELEYQPTKDLGWDCMFVTAEGGDVSSLLADLDSDPTVESAEYLGSIGEDHRFKVLISEGVPLVPPETTRLGVRLISIQYDQNSWHVQMHLPVQSALHRVQSHYHDQNITFRVKRLHVARETDIGAETALLPGQREALVVAYQNGYFDVPRTESQSEIANRLGISKSGVSQRIRRAISRLVEATLAP
ncbi:helix-turn-helix domain-containing protein [Haloferax larsenii]|uniref:Predicted DNA binding protein, contains HTH domain n=1 Tax=Haloferax larsenii TaxID=302484 RepID=A0A1H7V2Z2_HALLR|nr:helix-turn-helix domain-containing protein [Haloferax larsenii]SEM03409.1 Predicted DNA binding protein, contains HTH domain [Haloferax larsenii]